MDHARRSLGRYRSARIGYVGANVSGRVAIRIRPSAPSRGRAAGETQASGVVLRERADGGPILERDSRPRRMDQMSRRIADAGR